MKNMKTVRKIDKYMFGTFITFFILIFNFKIFEIKNLFSKILSLVT